MNFMKFHNAEKMKYVLQYGVHVYEKRKEKREKKKKKKRKKKVKIRKKDASSELSICI